MRSGVRDMASRRDLCVAVFWAAVNAAKLYLWDLAVTACGEGK